MDNIKLINHILHLIDTKRDEFTKKVYEERLKTIKEPENMNNIGEPEYRAYKKAKQELFEVVEQEVRGLFLRRKKELTKLKETLQKEVIND
jgi:arginine/lysine/ornithine decarboxylase